MRPCDEVTYDREVDAMHIALACEWSAKADEMQTFGGTGVLVDVIEGVPVGIEVLGASKHPVFSRLLPDLGVAELHSFRSGGVHLEPSTKENPTG